MIVLLVDFPDKPANRNAHEFEDMLFSTGIVPDRQPATTFYAEATPGQVLRRHRHRCTAGSGCRRRYAYYVNSQSGTGAVSHGTRRS